MDIPSHVSDPCIRMTALSSIGFSIVFWKDPISCVRGMVNVSDPSASRGLGFSSEER